MIKIRQSTQRGHFNHGWLDTFHTFSFGEYHDPEFMNFRALRVLNEDRVLPGSGFGMHPHENMEIVTIVLSGSLEHKDSLGNGSIIRPQEVQRMSAGTGILHSEFNPSTDEVVHFYQIWIIPAKLGVKPSYQQKHFPEKNRRGRLCLVTSPDGREDSLTIQQDVLLYAGNLETDETVDLNLAPERHAWIQVARGALQVNGDHLAAGDGAAVSLEQSLTLTGNLTTDLLVMDLP